MKLIQDPWKIIQAWNCTPFIKKKYENVIATGLDGKTAWNKHIQNYQIYRRVCKEKDPRKCKESLVMVINNTVIWMVGRMDIFFFCLFVFSKSW